MRERDGIRWRLATSFLVFWSIATAGAADRLTANINELAPRSRNNAPGWIEVSIHSTSTAIRQGALEFTLREWDFDQYRYRTHELAINTGDNRYRFLLPTVSMSSTSDDRVIRLEFIEKGGGRTVPLGAFPFTTQRRSSRSQAIAVVRPPDRRGGDTRPLWQVFRLERFAPEEGPMLDTTPAFLEPTDLPADPLGLCAFDLVLIEPDSLRTIRQKARDALAQWVAAGGSLCVVASSGIDPEHVEWLNRMAAGDPLWTPLSMDNTGNTKLPKSMNFGRANFGRLVVAAELPRDDAAQDNSDWRNACSFLWKVRPEQAALIGTTGQWRVKEFDRKFGTKAANTGKLVRPASFASLPARTIVDQLTPSNVRVVPMPAVLVVLGLFVVMIGPGDWFLLGLIRRHRWTWVLFPLMAALATGATVMLARHYTGTASVRSAFIITDLGVNGRVVRESRFDYELPVGQRTAVWPSTNLLRWPIWVAQYRTMREAQEMSQTLFEGQYPSRYAISRPMRQWIPTLLRSTSIGDGPDTSGVIWDAFVPNEFDEASSADVAVAMNPKRDAEVTFYFRGTDRTFTEDRKVDSRRWAAGTWTRWCRYATLTSNDGFGGQVSQISPHGFATFDDLPCIGDGDSSRTVIFVMKTEGANIHVWRRLYLH